MPGGDRHLRGGDLALHPAAPERGGLAEHGAVDRGPVADRLGARLARRAREDALRLGQQHEQARAGEDRDLGRERVVVAERDLVGRGRVVLVHDGHGAEHVERRERVARVDVGPPVGDLPPGEEDLRRGDALAAEGVVPRGLQTRLPERRGRLHLGHRAGPAVEAEPREPERDRAGGDDADRSSPR